MLSMIFFIVVATFASKSTETNSMPRKVLNRQVGVFGDVKDRQEQSLVARKGPLAQHGEAAPEGPSGRRGQEADELRHKIQDRSYRVKPRITGMEGGVRISLEEAGAFLAGSDQLSRDGREIVAEVGRFYRSEAVDFVVEAHTDDRSYRFSAHESDLDLTRAMAVSVGLVLSHDGGIGFPRIGISPFGAAQPIDSNATAAGRARNRRVEIVVRDQS